MADDDDGKRAGELELVTRLGNLGAAIAREELGRRQAEMAFLEYEKGLRRLGAEYEAVLEALMQGRGR